MLNNFLSVSVSVDISQFTKQIPFYLKTLTHPCIVSMFQYKSCLSLLHPVLTMPVKLHTYLLVVTIMFMQGGRPAQFGEMERKY